MRTPAGAATSNVSTPTILGVIGLFLSGLQTETMQKRCYAAESETSAAPSLGSLATMPTISFSESEPKLISYDEYDQKLILNVILIKLLTSLIYY